ncbi:MAG: YkgJ family cysteine cluster protein [Verrucomicrobiota bacterium]
MSSPDSNPVYYECQRCGNCCRWPGVVRLKENEIEPIADFLKIDPLDFVQDYCEILPDRGGLGLISRPNHECIFLEGKNSCKIQSVKPSQCSGFPNLWKFPGWQDVCEAKPLSSENLTDEQKKFLLQTAHPSADIC